MVGRLTGGSNRGLYIPAEKLGKLRSANVETLRLTNLVDDILITPHLQPGERSKPLLYGDLRFLHVAEVMALISSMRKGGSLSILVPYARKTIYFSEGEVVYASSNVEDDRLSEILWRWGYITLEQLSGIYDQVRPDKKAGMLLMEQGVVSPSQLYQGIKQQVLEIVYSTFCFKKGEFVFVEGKVNPKGTIKLDMNTRELIMEGLRRMGLTAIKSDNVENRDSSMMVKKEKAKNM